MLDDESDVSCCLPVLVCVTFVEVEERLDHELDLGILEHDLVDLDWHIGTDFVDVVTPCPEAIFEHNRS